MLGVMVLKNVFTILTGTALGALIGAAAGTLVGCAFGVGAELGYGPLIFTTWLVVGTAMGAFFGFFLNVAKVLARASNPKP
jgi:hypothetical protein